MRRPLFALLIGIGLTVACDPSNPCDPGQTPVNGLCQVNAPPVVATDAGEEGGSCVAANRGYGASCAAVADCPCGLDYCQTYGGANYCTHTGCGADGGACPSGWSCTDLSVFSPGQPSICTRP